MVRATTSIAETLRSVASGFPHLVSRSSKESLAGDRSGSARDHSSRTPWQGWGDYVCRSIRWMSRRALPGCRFPTPGKPRSSRHWEFPFHESKVSTGADSSIHPEAATNSCRWGRESACPNGEDTPEDLLYGLCSARAPLPIFASDETSNVTDSLKSSSRVRYRCISRLNRGGESANSGCVDQNIPAMPRIAVQVLEFTMHLHNVCAQVLDLTRIR